MSDSTLNKSLPFEVKAVSEQDRVVEGYAAAFGNVDSYGDVLMSGAFGKTIREGAGRVKVVWQHDAWSGVIGKPLEMREDDYGLFTRSYISKTQLGDDALTLAADGVIDEMSIGYRLVPGKFESNETGGLDLHEVRLMEYSLVTWAANQRARVTAVKSEQLIEAVRSLSSEDREMLKALLGTEPAPATQPPPAAAAKAGEPDLHSLAAAIGALSGVIPSLKELLTND